MVSGLAGRSAQNFEVYVKKGATLHSKALTIDGIYSWTGSRNFHPRSFRYEGEMIMSVLDRDFAKSVESMIQADINQASRISTPIDPQPNLLTDAVDFYFYDQL